MVNTAVQLYSLRGIDASLPDVLDLVGETPVDGVEFATRIRADDTDLEAVADALERNDLVPVAAHVELPALKDDFDEVTSRYARLGCETLVVPWLEPDRFESETAVANAAARLETVAADLAVDGFELQYHNHDQEFVSLGDGTGLDELVARTADVGLEVDLGWARAAGADPAAVVDAYADRISHVHVADVDVETGTCVELGDGDLELERALEATRRADVEWVVYEHDDPADPRESLVRGTERLDALS